MSSLYFLSSQNNHFYGPRGETQYFVTGSSIYTLNGPTGYSISDKKIYGPSGYTGCYLDENGYLYGYVESLPFF